MRNNRVTFPDMKKLLILTSILLSATTTGMFAADAAPMPSVNIPANPATPAAPAQAQAASPTKGKHKTKKHKKHQKKADDKKPEVK